MLRRPSIIFPVILAGGIFLTAVNHAIQHWVIIPGFEMIEQQQAEEELQRVIDAIAREAEHLDILAGDWAVWDDSYQFIGDGNTDYIESNLHMDTLEAQSDIHLMFFYDLEQHAVWGQVYVASLGGNITIDEFPSTAPSYASLLQHRGTAGSHGVINSSVGLLLVASHPILNTQGDKAAVGTLVIGRLLDRAHQQQLVEQTRVEFTFSESLPEDRQLPLLAVQASGKSLITAVSDDELQIRGVIDDIDGEPAQLIIATLQRDIMAQGIRVARFASVSALVSLILLLAIVLLGAKYYTLSIRSSNREIKKLVDTRTDELRLAVESAEKSSLMAATANESKSIFLANISHEIRTPMNAIINLSYLTLQGELADKPRNYIEKLNRSANALLRIINDILDLSKVEAGKMEIDESDFSLDDLLSNLAVVDSIKNKNAQVKLVFDVAPEAPLFLHGDILRINQVLINLFSNAIKFTESGTITLSINVLDDHDGVAVLAFLVEDTGIGMPQQIADKMFEPFSQASASTSRHYGGTGLGLVICKQLCQLMGGELTLISEPGKGTRAGAILPLPVVQRSSVDMINDWRVLLLGRDQHTVQAVDNTLRAFNVQVSRGSTLTGDKSSLADVNVIIIDESYSADEVCAFCQQLPPEQLEALALLFLSNDEKLPVALADQPVNLLREPVYFSGFIDALSFSDRELPDRIAAAEPLSALSQKLQRRLGRQRILIAEDNELNQEIISNLLANIGADIVLAANGQLAIEQLQQRSDIDIMLMDVQMPVMDGMQATAEIRRHEQWNHIPIIGLSANASQDDINEGLSIGMQAYLTKPIIPEKLFAALSRWGTHRPEDALAPLDETPVQEITAARVSAEFIANTSTMYEGLDIAAGLKVCNGKEVLYKKLLVKFSDHHRETADKVAMALQQDPAQARSLLHNLTGIAANIGALELSALSRKLDEALKAGKLEHPQQSLAELSDVLGKTCQSIQSYCN